MMKVSLLLLGLTLLFACAIAYEIEDDVYVLTPDNFDDFVAENPNSLIEFYAPWCGHCKKLAPEFSAAAKQLDVKLAKVDAAEHQELGQRFEVRGFPTLYWFTDGTPEPYGGGRTAPEIVSYVTKMTTSELVTLTTAEEIEEFLANKPAVISYNAGEEADTSLLRLYRSGDQYGIASVTDAELFDESLNGKIVLSRDHDEDLTIEFTEAQALYDYLAENAFPRVVEFDNFQFNRLMSKTWLLIGVVDFADADAKAGLIETMNGVETNDIGLMYGDKAVLSRGVEGAGATGNVYPTFVAVNPTEQKQLVWDESIEITVESVNTWVAALLDGTATTFKKSEPIPENNDGPVTTLVQKNFDDIVKGNNVFVKYYAPWCGHCKSLAPTWEELGEAFADEDVVIAKIDATANHIEEPVQGFPTLVFYKKDGSSVKFDGGRSLEDLSAFVTMNIGGDLKEASHAHDEL